jgi:hypothetical protein
MDSNALVNDCKSKFASFGPSFICLTRVFPTLKTKILGGSCG